MNFPVKKTVLIFLPLLALAVGGWYAYGQSDYARPAERYKTQALERGPLQQTVSANGALNPVKLVNVGTQVSGTVKKLHVDFNDKVEQGQLLAELDDALLAAQARQSAANVDSAQASLALAQANEKRMRGLFGQEYVSRQELDQAVQAQKTAAAALALARAQADKDRTNLSYAAIRSPVSGVIVSRSIDVGQTVAASFQTPTFFQIAQDLSRMQIDTSFPEADIGSIRVGQAARFTVDTFPSRSFTGQVRQIRLSPSTQQNVVTYNVVVAVDNPDEALMPGMTAYVNIAVAQKKDVLKAPNASLRFKPSTPPKEERPPGEGKEKAPKRKAGSGTIHVLRDGELKAVAVTLGMTDGKSSEIVDGELQAGDLAVIAEIGAAPAAKSSSVGMRMF